MCACPFSSVKRTSSSSPHRLVHWRSLQGSVHRLRATTERLRMSSTGDSLTAGHPGRLSFPPVLYRPSADLEDARVTSLYKDKRGDHQFSFQRTQVYWVSKLLPRALCRAVTALRKGAGCRLRCFSVPSKDLCYPLVWVPGPFSRRRFSDPGSPGSETLVS